MKLGHLPKIIIRKSSGISALCLASWPGGMESRLAKEELATEAMLCEQSTAIALDFTLSSPPNLSLLSTLSGCRVTHTSAAEVWCHHLLSISVLSM